MSIIIYNIDDVINIPMKKEMLRTRIDTNFELNTDVYYLNFDFGTKNLEIYFSGEPTEKEKNIIETIKKIIFDGKNVDDIFPDKRTIISTKLPATTCDMYNGYKIGDEIIYTPGNQKYTCFDNVKDNAVWLSDRMPSVNNINIVYVGDNNQPCLTYNNSNWKIVSTILYPGLDALNGKMPSQLSVILSTIGSSMGSFQIRIIDFLAGGKVVASISSSNCSDVPGIYTTTEFNNVSKTMTIWELDIIGKPNNASNISTGLYSVYIKLD